MVEDHKPVPGRLYRLMGSYLKHLTLNIFEGSESIYGASFQFCPEEGFLLCLPRLVKDIPEAYNFFLVSGTQHTIAWYGIPTKQDQTDMLWLEEVICDVE